MIDEHDERTGPPQAVQDAHDFLQEMYDSLYDAALTFMDEKRFVHIPPWASAAVEKKLMAGAIADAAMRAFLALDGVDVPDEARGTWSKP